MGNIFSACFCMNNDNINNIFCASDYGKHDVPNNLPPPTSPNKNLENNDLPTVFVF